MMETPYLMMAVDQLALLKAVVMEYSSPQQKNAMTQMLFRRMGAHLCVYQSIVEME